MSAVLLRRLEVEDFLYQEAALLDDWKLKEWLALFAPEARYEVAPTGDPEAGTCHPPSRCSWSRTIASVSSNA